MFQHGALEELRIPDAESASFEADKLELSPDDDGWLGEPQSTDPEPPWPDQSGAVGLSAARRRADREEDEPDDDDAFYFGENGEEVEEEEEEYEDEEFFEEDEDDDFGEPEEEGGEDE